MKQPRNTVLPPLDPNQRYTIDEAKAYLRCSHSHLYEKFARGEIQKIKDGRLTYVPGTEIIKASTLQGAA